jgi:hypothetical protein
MTGENAMPTPIFDQLLREMAQRAEPAPQHARPNMPSTATKPEPQTSPADRSGTGRRHRAE